jgi:hypothetical protein
MDTEKSPKERILETLSTDYGMTVYRVKKEAMTDWATAERNLRQMLDSGEVVCEGNQWRKTK